MYKNKKEIEKWFRYLRDLICNEFEKFEKNTKFKKKKWRRKKLSNGGGEISILRDGKVFEKVGVNISTVFGSFDRKSIQNTSFKEIEKSQVCFPKYKTINCPQKE